jgi:hypothetical protein
MILAQTTHFVLSTFTHSQIINRLWVTANTVHLSKISPTWSAHIVHPRRFSPVISTSLQVPSFLLSCAYQLLSHNVYIHDTLF